MTFGNYIILRELGAGGMGKVYLARHLHTDRPVVIKVLLPEYISNDRLVQRFYTEARILAELDHPAIVRLYDFAVQDGMPYLVMEYVDGIPLETILEREGTAPLGLEWAYTHLEPIFHALAYVHTKDIIHRDIKPSNIMILSAGGAKLLDFGIAKAIDAEYKLTQTGTQVGTALYMAPEQILGLPVTHRTDLYAMGLILYQCAFGRYPWDWQGKTLFQIYQMLSTEPPPFPAYAPPEQRAFFEKALAKAAEQRFPSAEAMLEALKQLAFPHKQSSTTQKASSAPLSSPRVEALDSPPTYTHKSTPSQQESKKANEPVISAGVISIGIGILAAALLHKPLGLLGWIAWSLTVSSLIYGLYRRFVLLLGFSAFLGGLLGYFYLYAYPKAKKISEEDAIIHSALTVEIERYRADSLAYLLGRRGIPKQKIIDIQIAPLPPPTKLPDRKLPIQEVRRILQGQVRPSYPPRGRYTLAMEAEYSRYRKSSPYRREIPCEMRCGIFGLQTCTGTQTVWYSDSWQEACTLRGSLTIIYTYERESRRLLRYFDLALAEKDNCQELAGTRRQRIEYQDRCR